MALSFDPPRSELRERGSAARDQTTNRVELGDFLRRRREGLQPAELDLPTDSRRRTPGLRRDEVAKLAHMSVVYYERLEQARGPQPSASMLAAVAQALRLTAEERTHLYTLAGRAAPTSAQPATDVDAGLTALLHDLAPGIPAFISDDLGNVLFQNELNTLLFGDLPGRPGREANVIWLWFTSAGWRSHFCAISAEDEEATSLSYIADLRRTLARRGHDAAATELVADLRAASAEFATMWDQHRVSYLECHRKIVMDDRVGPLTLDCVVAMSPSSTQRLLMLTGAPDTGTAERLVRLTEMIDGAGPFVP